MTKFLSPSALSLSAILLPGLALADVSPADVWANQTALFKAMGGAVTANLSEGGTTTVVSEISGNFALPMGLGAASLSISDVKLVDNGDGTVTLRYPADTDFTMGLDVPGQVNGSITLRIIDGYAQLAGGEPGDVTYTYDVPSLRLEITDFAADGPALDNADLAMLKGAVAEGVMSIFGNAGTLQITEGDMLSLSLDAKTTSQEFDFSFGILDSVVSRQTGSAGASRVTAELILPAQGVSVMALPAALRDGLSLHLESDVMQNVSEQVTELNGQVIKSQRDVTERIVAAFSFDAEGLRMSGKGEDMAVNLLDPEILPFPIDLAAQQVTVALQMPLLASDQPLPFALQFGLAALSLPDNIWTMVDADGVLPRDPADINIDVAGKMGSSLDLLDFVALKKLNESSDMPFSIHALTIADILVSAAGAQLTGSGDFTFDMDDLGTFDGMPAPTGTLNLAIDGANGLLDKLIEIGVLPEQDAMGARMGLGMFTRPGKSDDNLLSTIEIDGASGSISANGMRLK